MDEPTYYYEQSDAAAGTGLLIGLGLLFACAIWVYVDARRIGARKGLIPGFLDIGPIGWAVGTVLFWILAFPLYLAQRGPIKRAVQQRDDRSAHQFQQPGVWGQQPWQSTPMAAPPQAVMPPPGWYDDPYGPGYSRWWDGQRWTEHRTEKPL